jgi:3-hydroxybutyrate dehydrogenase
MHERCVAVVTSSTSGIGLGIAEALAAEGTDIVLNGFGDAAAIEKVRLRLAEESGVRVSYSSADVSKAAEARGLIERVTREFGRVDILVNNASAQHIAWVQEFPIEAWDSILALNLSAAFHATAAVLPQMLRRDWGRIVNVACGQGPAASLRQCAYIAAKDGVIGLTKVVAHETASSGVTCNAVCPGWGSAAAHTDPQQEVATAAQVGGLVAFLCSADAAQIRGAAVPIDAWVAQREVA